MYVSEIADKLGYELVGDDRQIYGIGWYNVAKKNDIAIARNKTELHRTDANVVLTEPVITYTTKTLLITYESIDCSLVKICKVLMDNGVYKDYSIPPQYTLNELGYYVGQDCNIDDTAIIQPGVKIGNHVFVGANCVIDPDVYIGSGTFMEDNVQIGSGSKIGVSSFYHYNEEEKLYNFNGIGRVKIGCGTVIGCNTVVQRGSLVDTCIGSNNMIGNCIDIGHDVKIGDNCKIVSQTGIASNVEIKDNVTIYGQVGIANGVIIGNGVVIKGKTVVSKSVYDYDIVYGPFGRNYFEEMKLITTIRKYFNRKDE